MIYLEITEKFINFVEIYRRMARELTRIIADLRKRLAVLASQRDEARGECAILNEKVASLTEQLEQCRSDLAMSRMEVDFLTVSHRAATPGNLIAARRRVQRLIAKIDRCVALLKEDADIN